MQPRALLAVTAFIAAASAAPIAGKRQLPIVGGLIGGLPVVGPILGGVGGGGIGGVGGLAGGKQVASDPPATALPKKETEELVKRKEAVGIPDLNTDLGSLTGIIGGLPGLPGIVPRSESI